MIALDVLLVLVGYLMGSISFARVILRFAAPGQTLADLTINVGDDMAPASISGVGANTASTILGPRWGAAIALLDIAKAALPTAVAAALAPDTTLKLWVALASLIGHNWPIYYRFKGGRGFSPMLGGLLVIDPWAVPVTIAAGLLLGFVVIRNVAVAYVLWVWLLVPWLAWRHAEPAFTAYGVALLILFQIAAWPETRTFFRYRQAGKLDEYMAALTGASPRWRGMQRLARSLDLIGRWRSRRDRR